jgi:hypothetical protein
MLLCCLEDLGILNNGIVTWNFYQNNRTLPPAVSEENKSNEHVFLTTVPPTRINDTVVWDDSLRIIYKKHHNKFYNQTDRTKIIESYKISCTVEDHILKSFLYVITETVFDYPYRFITEKTFKTFLNKRPFVIVGPPGTLKQIKQLGFKTFDSIIDESYDEIVDPSARLTKVVKIIESISQLSIDEMKKIMVDIQPILDFNHDHYHNNYCQTDLKRTLSIL